MLDAGDASLTTQTANARIARYAMRGWMLFLRGKNGC
jgi:hypothetical protein